MFWALDKSMLSIYFIAMMTFHRIYQRANWKTSMIEGSLIFQVGILWLSIIIDYITIVQFLCMMHLFFKDQKHNYFCAAPLPDVSPPRHAAPTAASHEYNFYFEGIMFAWYLHVQHWGCLILSYIEMFFLHQWCCSILWCCSSHTSSMCSCRSPCPSCCSCAWLSRPGSWWKSTGKKRSPWVWKRMWWWSGTWSCSASSRDLWC